MTASTAIRSNMLKKPVTTAILQPTGRWELELHHSAVRQCSRCIRQQQCSPAGAACRSKLQDSARPSEAAELNSRSGLFRPHNTKTHPTEHS